MPRTPPAPPAPEDASADADLPRGRGAEGKRLGAEVIRAKLKHLPAKPGVYRMFGENGDVLYVGKARNLKARVANYANKSGHSQRIALMIRLTAGMEFVVTETESEALLLEASLIKSLKPRFNILLRDDKSFPYILIRRDHPAPQITKYRGSKRNKGDYFGPFASAGAVTRTLDTLQKAFLLRTCEDSVFATRERPCINYQIKRCAAPCTGEVSEEEYAALADQAADFLSGKGTDLQDRLAAEMEAAAEAMDFERAARLRDRIRALAVVRSNQSLNVSGLKEADVFGIALEGGQACVQVFFVRAGQNWGASAFYPRVGQDDAPGEVLSAFLSQFYGSRPPPRLILTSTDADQAPLIEDALELSAERTVTITRPMRGAKRALAVQAENNAKEALSRKLAETASQAKLLAGVAKAFDLPRTPERVEVYDNSHIQGSHAVGGMIVAGPDGFDKSQYRKFNIKDEALSPGDDFGMMREVMRRRFARLLKEARAELSKRKARLEESGDAEAAAAIDLDAVPGRDVLEALPAYPDLVLIDGGKGQLSAVEETLAELGLSPKHVTLVSIAKGVDRNAGRESFFMPGRAPFKMPMNSPVLYFLQRLRDEAHRWAIGAHRAKRSAQIVKSPLDEIQGIGPARKKALLHRFGSAKAVGRASLADIASVDGVNQALAERIHGHFHGG